MQKSNSQTEIFCGECGSKKESKYCGICKRETPALFKKTLCETINLKASLRNLLKSGEKVGSKPRKEIEQYVGNKDENVVSEIERLREKGKPTKVIHRLWRKSGVIFKKIHEHGK